MVTNDATFDDDTVVAIGRRIDGDGMNAPLLINFDVMVSDAAVVRVVDAADADADAASSKTTHGSISMESKTCVIQRSGPYLCCREVVTIYCYHRRIGEACGGPHSNSYVLRAWSAMPWPWWVWYHFFIFMLLPAIAAARHADVTVFGARNPIGDHLYDMNVRSFAKFAFLLCGSAFSAGLRRATDRRAAA